MGRILTEFEIEPGDTADLPLACVTRSGLPCVFSPSDTLSADLWRQGGTSALATLPAAWLTLDGAQTGFDQGEIAVTLSNAATATLQPGVAYLANAYRVLASDPSRKERIATARIRVRVPAPA